MAVFTGNYTYAGMLFGLLSVDKNLFEYVAGILKISSGWMLTMQFDSVLQPSEVRWLIILIACYVLLIIGNLWSNYKSSAAIIASCASMFSFINMQQQDTD